MKRLSFLVLCAALTAFAGPYDIESFDAQDSGSPDEYISAEFGGELKTVPASEVESLQEGRLVVRQKFQDPFGESEPTYQLYQGGAGDLSSLTPMSASSASISDLVSAKIYKRRGLDAEDDVEKVYFDSKFVYIPGLSSAIAFVNDSPVDLKGDAPALAKTKTLKQKQPPPRKQPLNATNTTPIATTMTMNTMFPAMFPTQTESPMNVITQQAAQQKTQQTASVSPMKFVSGLELFFLQLLSVVQSWACSST